MVSFRLLCGFTIPYMAFAVRVEYVSYLDTQSFDAEVGRVRPGHQRRQGLEGQGVEGKRTEVCCAKTSNQGYTSFKKKMNTCEVTGMARMSLTKGHRTKVADACCAGIEVDAKQDVKASSCTSDGTDCKKYGAVPNGDKCECSGDKKVCSQGNQKIEDGYRFECDNFNSYDAKKFKLQCTDETCEDYDAIASDNEGSCTCPTNKPIATHRPSKLLSTDDDTPALAKNFPGNPDTFILSYAHALDVKCFPTSECTHPEYNGAVEADEQPGFCSCGQNLCKGRSCKYNPRKKEWIFKLDTAYHKEISCVSPEPDRCEEYGGFHLDGDAPSECRCRGTLPLMKNNTKVQGKEKFTMAEARGEGLECRIDCPHNTHTIIDPELGRGENYHWCQCHLRTICHSKSGGCQNYDDGYGGSQVFPSECTDCTCRRPCPKGTESLGPDKFDASVEVCQCPESKPECHGNPADKDCWYEEEGDKLLEGFWSDCKECGCHAID